MPISKANLDEIMEDEQIGDDARRLLFAFFDHDVDGGADGRWPTLRGPLRELEHANYVMRGDAWKSQAGGHLLLFDRRQEPTIELTLPPLPSAGFGRDVLYVIGQPGTGIAKIGITGNVKSRLRTIQTGSPVPVAVRWWHPGDYDLERQLHQEFAEYRMHGEWFDFGVEEPEILVEMAVQARRPEEFPPPAGAREDLSDYMLRYPADWRYGSLLGTRPASDAVDAAVNPAPIPNSLEER